MKTEGTFLTEGHTQIQRVMTGVEVSASKSDRVQLDFRSDTPQSAVTLGLELDQATAGKLLSDLLALSNKIGFGVPNRGAG